LLEERSLPFMGISVWAAPVAALVTMVIGFLWYSLLFARPWVVLMGCDPEDKAKLGET
jgi:hypothetical protein